ncbi:PTS sugar transporter subunit IIC [Celerinatantimonas sp. YJH-8]|uniref:PTS sugar transporter subunit IIC n=1 Tax=Celerinatantimonas sp. YJH-8 TaxID=3228714 RepID=UPI0038C96AF8
MQLIANAIEEYIAPVAKLLTNSKHILAVRDGFQLAMPFIFVGSLFVPLLYPPFIPTHPGTFAQSWLVLSRELRPLLLPAFQLTSGLISLIISFGAAASLAKHYQLPQRFSGLTGCISFLLLIGFFTDQTAAIRYLGGMGIFTATFASLYAVEIIHQFYTRGWFFSMPEEVPQITRNGFALIIPLFFILLSLSCFNLILKHYWGLPFPQLMETIFQPLIIASDSLPAILLSLLVCNVLFFIGIHGSILVTGIMNPFWLSNLAVNQHALAAGQAIPHIYTQGFWDYYLLIGGVGSTLPLMLMAFRSRSQQLRSVGKLGFIPSLFNINEPILFGFPIIMNPLFLIPFISVPMINATIAWYLTKLEILDRFIAMLPWSMPAPIGAAWAANGSLNNALMSILAISISWSIYRPFFNVHEKMLLKQAQRARSAN